MTRSPQETFSDHVRALGSGDLDAIAVNFAPDAVFLTPAGVLHRREGVKQGIGAVLADLPNARWKPGTPVFADDVMLLEWAADADGARVEDGVDTFVFRDGLIRAQTVRYTLLTEPTD
ncbi:nuclear transport factor 2 family protein [Streptomyces nigra]|uniref:nuclear transport factor 2 family protein n=1 Tax=Streptomyces nigra TaxID=1827580 RepID=UPI0030D6063C